MKFKLLLAVSISIFINCNAVAQFCVPEQGIAFQAKAMNQINPKHIRWIKSTAADISSGKILLDSIDQQATSYGQLNNLQDMDIEALISLIMLEASNDARKDLRELMVEINEANEKKKAMRDAVNLMKKKQAEIKNKVRQEYTSRKQYDSLKKLLTPSAVINPGTASASAAEWSDFLNSTRDQLDSLNEVGEMQTLRLQMYMDRLNKMISTLSNLMKKISQTQDNIVQNLK